MGQVLLLLGQLLARTATQLALSLATSLGVTAIVNLLKPEQGGSTWVQVSNEVGTSLSEIENGTYGLAALAALVATARTDILAAIGTPQQSGVAVTLPTTPPSGYGGLDAGATGSAVWTFLVNGGAQAQQALTVAYNVALGNLGRGSAHRVYKTHWWVAWLRDTVPTRGDEMRDITPLFDDPGTILAADDLLAWLQRVNPTWTLTRDANNVVGMFDTAEVIQFATLLDDATFAQLQKLAVAGTEGGSAPVWPGLAGVFVGDTVPFTGDITVSTNMQGVIVEITSVPAGTSFFDFDGNVSWRFLGALVFQNDNGQFEAPQNLGFTQAVYLPKSMSYATAVALRVKPGVIGTVTTFSTF